MIQKIYVPLPQHPEPLLIEIEVVTSLQIPQFQIIGLPSKVVQESRERVRAAFASSGIEFPRRKVIVNLSPSEVAKNTAGLDLGIALAVLAERGLIPNQFPIAAWGELSLDGTVLSSPKIFRSLSALSKLAPKGTRVLLGKSQWEEVTSDPLYQSVSPSPFGNLEFLPISNLKEALLLKSHPPIRFRPIPHSTLAEPADSSQVSLPDHLIRILQIAMIGNHHLLLLGPKGMGKSHFIKSYKSLFMPDLGRYGLERRNLFEWAGIPAVFEKEWVKEIATDIHPSRLLGLRKPGELAQAHGGVLIADEFPEWHRDAKESLRVPLESNKGRLFLNQTTYEYPLHFQLIAAGNLCPCGEWSGPAFSSHCRCSHREQQRYLQKISGPILDRIHLVHVLRKNTQLKSGRSSVRELKKQIQSSRHILTHSVQCTDHTFDHFVSNWGLNNIRDQVLLKSVAKSICALDSALNSSAPLVNEQHLIEALQFRASHNLFHNHSSGLSTTDSAVNA